jgi:hypothetical protein
VLDTEGGKPVAVLDHDPAHPGIGQDLPQRGRAPPATSVATRLSAACSSAS